MVRTPSTFYTEERRRTLETVLGQVTPEENLFLAGVGEYSATKLWPRYEEINQSGIDGDFGAFRDAIGPLIDPEGIQVRGAFLNRRNDVTATHDYEGVRIPVYMMALEMISQGSPSVALSLAIDGSVLDALWHLGDEDQVERYVADAIEHKHMHAFGLTDPRHGSDAANVDLTATLEGDHYLFEGQKSWITNAGWAEYYFVVARTNSDVSLGENGLSIIMVHKDEIGNVRQMKKFATPGSYTGELSFDGPVPMNDGVARMIGEQDTGYSSAKDLLRGGRITIGVYGLGIATEAFDMADDYARDRMVNGKHVRSIPAKSLEFAELYVELQAARLLTYAAAKHMDEGNLTDIEASMAKLAGTRVSREIAQANIDMHGANGTAIEYRANQLRNDTDVGVTGEGTNNVQLAIISAKLRAQYLDLLSPARTT